MTDPLLASRLGLGTWQLVGDDCRRIVELALELGYRHIDTAQSYGNEAEVGRALAGSAVPRSAVFLTTKVWPDDLVTDPKVVDRSLERLGVDRVDLLLIHWPSPRHPLERTIAALVRAAEGRADHIGVSNFPPLHLARALAVTPSIRCHQFEHHPYLAQRHWVRRCQARGLLATAYCPLARGRVARDPTLTAIAARYGKSAAQIALRWLLEEEGVAAVPKASTEAHLRANLDLFDFALTSAEISAIDKLDRRERLIDPDFAPDWGADPDE